MRRKIFTQTAQTDKRKYLRNNQSRAELILWSKLKNKQVLGYKFRRQHSIGKFVIDFYCPAVKLAIEVDGDSHFMGDGGYDVRRQNFIESFGLTFLRFTNTDIFKNIAEVVEKIIEELRKAPPPTPPQGGGGLLG